jgi:hypothetical protein
MLGHASRALAVLAALWLSGAVVVGCDSAESSETPAFGAPDSSEGAGGAVGRGEMDAAGSSLDDELDAGQGAAPEAAVDVWQADDAGPVNAVEDVWSVEDIGEPDVELGLEPDVASEPDVAPEPDVASEPDVAPEPDVASEPDIEPDPIACPGPGPTGTSVGDKYQDLELLDCDGEVVQLHDHCSASPLLLFNFAGW